MRIIKGGTLVTPEGLVEGDLAFRGGVITAVGGTIEPEASDGVTDVTGCLVFPGFIDGHTHLEAEVATGTTADDFESGTRAAACGGTTTIVDYATQEKGGTLAEALDTWKGRAEGHSACDTAFHMAVTDWNARTADEVDDMVSAGVTSFKVYMAYDNLRLDDAQILELLDVLGPKGCVMGCHCENGTLVDALQARELAAGHTAPSAHPASRPPEVEAEAISRLCWLAQMSGATVNVVHLSTAAGLEVIRQARRRGVKVLVETCPQYLLLDDEAYDEPDFGGAKYVMSPPLRKPIDRAALRAAVIGGEVDTIATDHCSFTMDQKRAGIDDFTKIPNGGPGVEHRPALMMTTFAHDLDAVDLCRLMSENPARVFGMYPEKGVLAVGSDADVCVWDPRERWMIRAATQQQATDITPYEGFEVTGRARYVYVGGVLVACDGKPTGATPGHYVPRHATAAPIHVGC